MSKETRDNLVKLAKAATEKCKVGIRRMRQKGISEARKAKGEVSDDDIKRTEKQVSGLQLLVACKVSVIYSAFCKCLKLRCFSPFLCWLYDALLLCSFHQTDPNSHRRLHKKTRELARSQDKRAIGSMTFCVYLGHMVSRDTGRIPRCNMALACALGSRELGQSVQTCTVLVVGAGGIGCELVKNLVLTGFGDIHLVRRHSLCGLLLVVKQCS